MSKRTHTPGPWKVIHNSRNCTINVVSTPDADGCSVKVALVNFQDEANANLIALAPTLLSENTNLRSDLAAAKARAKRAEAVLQKIATVCSDVAPVDFIKQVAQACDDAILVLAQIEKETGRD